MVVPAVLLEITLEAEATVVALPTAILDLVIKSDPEAEPFEAPPSPDYDEPEGPFKDNTPEAAKTLPDQVTPSPPVQITPTSLIEPTPAPPVISHDTRATTRMIVHLNLTFPLGYRVSIAWWNTVLLSILYPSHSSGYSTSLSRSSSVAPSLPHSSPSRKRSHYLSPSSSGTSHSSSPLPRRIHCLSSYSTPPASIEPSHKRCRSPTTSLPATASSLTVLSSVPADRLPPRKRYRGSPTISYQDATIEAAAEPVSPPTVKDRLGELNYMIRWMYEHLFVHASIIEEEEHIFARQGDIAPTALDTKHAIELTDRKLVGDRYNGTTDETLPEGITPESFGYSSRYKHFLSSANKRPSEKTIQTDIYNTSIKAATFEKREIRFSKWGKQNPQYIGPFEVPARDETVAYKPALPQQISKIHNTFHVSNEKKCFLDETLVISLDKIQIDDKLHFIEEPESQTTKAKSHSDHQG
uniref:Putative reverse transcriptase domain-containing protein n=1 Tax=Tanacetum cinerariifolium TaxID=118510 RepID=A0A6L2NAW0_TANCI|nr:putative reverse transcriptase domain-containing protein [Tanacetum cinerariifolium]